MQHLTAPSAGNLEELSPEDLVRGMLSEPRDPRWIADPYAYYARLRAVAPVFESSLGLWIITQYEDVDIVLHHKALSQGLKVASDPRYESSPTLRSYANWIVHLDPPLHDVVRGVVAKVFSKRNLEGWRDYITGRVDELLTPLQELSTFDFVTDFAGKLPVSVICELLGVAASDRDKFDRWARALVATEFAIVPDDLLAVADQAVLEMDEYVRGLVAARGEGGDDDLLDLLIAGHRDGALTEAQMMGLAQLMLVAGADTTTEFLGNGMYALLRFPDEISRLRREPELMSNAVHELMRFDGPAHFSHTKVTLDDSLSLQSGTIALPAGSQVMPVLSSANHDPEHFENPTQLDVGRGKIRHFGFTAGVHTCLGANLARLEAELAFQEFFGRCKTVTLAGDPEWAVHGNLRGIRHLPVSCEWNH